MRGDDLDNTYLRDAVNFLQSKYKFIADVNIANGIPNPGCILDARLTHAALRTLAKQKYVQ